ncbi:hypothetical protein MARHY2225 [Marinobacter nauticus ATCC 49840]|nr:hypothetical protein MARHY2225 [Marinobacter nauticus ATCC 49840]
MSQIKKQFYEQESGGWPEYFNPGEHPKSVFEQEVSAGGSDGLGARLLPGGDHHIGHAVTLAGKPALGVRFPVQAGPKIVEGEIDNSGHAEGVLGHNQINSRRHFHKTTNHTAMNGGQDRIAQVLFLCGQAEDQVITKSVALQANPAGVRDTLHHPREVAGFLGVAQNFRVGHSSPPVIRSR